MIRATKAGYVTKRLASAAAGVAIAGSLANGAIVYSYVTRNFATQGEASNSAIAVAPATESGPPKFYPRPVGPAQWPAYGGGGANLNYSPLQQITPANVANLKPA